MWEDFCERYVKRLQLLEARILKSFRSEHDKKDAMIILTAMKEGHTTPSATVRVTGLTLQQVIRIRKRLKLLARQIIKLEE